MEALEQLLHLVNTNLLSLTFTHIFIIDSITPTRLECNT